MAPGTNQIAGFVEYPLVSQCFSVWGGGGGERSISFYLPIGNIWLRNSKHVDCGLVQLNEDTIMDLAKTEQLKNLSHLWTHAIDTNKQTRRKMLLY